MAGEKKLLDGIDDSQKGKVDSFVWQEYFLPLHIEIRVLIKAKYYLAGDSNVEQSIKKYLVHSTQELFQTRIVRELDISTHHVEGLRWPSCFHSNVTNKMENLRQKRDELIKNLESNSPNDGN